MESMLNPDEQLMISSGRKASIMPADNLYTTNWAEPTHRVYSHYSEERLRITTEEDQTKFSFITLKSYQ